MNLFQRFKTWNDNRKRRNRDLRQAQGYNYAWKQLVSEDQTVEEVQNDADIGAAFGDPTDAFDVGMMNACRNWQARLEAEKARQLQSQHPIVNIHAGA